MYIVFTNVIAQSFPTVNLTFGTKKEFDKYSVICKGSSRSFDINILNELILIKAILNELIFLPLKFSENL